MWIVLALAQDASFEADGVRIGGALVTGANTELRRVGGAPVVVSANVIVPLLKELTVSLGGGKTIVLQPNVKLRRTTDGFQLSIEGKNIQLGNVVLASPASFQLLTDGFDFGLGRVIRGAQLSPTPVAAPATPATPTTPTPAVQPKTTPPPTAKTAQKLKLRRIFDADPWGGSNAADSVLFRQLRKVSPAGY